MIISFLNFISLTNRNEYPITEQPFRGVEMAVISGSQGPPRGKSYHSAVTSQPSGSAPRHIPGEVDGRRDSEPVSGVSSSPGRSILDIPLLRDELSGLGGYDVIRIVQQIERDLIGNYLNVMIRFFGTPPR